MNEDYHKTIILDIETTGLIPKKEVPGKRPWTTKKVELSHEEDFAEFPRVLSIAWKVDDDDTMYYLCNQEGQPIPEEATAINGITEAMTNSTDITFKDAVLKFHEDAKDCEVVVGHGIYFDTSIIKANIMKLVSKEKLSRQFYDEMTEILHKHKRIDTMRSTAKMMRKWPTLHELHQKIFHKGFEAHSAAEDVEACFRCYGWLKKKGIVPTWEELQEKANPLDRSKEV